MEVRCPHDPTHQTFQGDVIVFGRQAVHFGPDGNVVTTGAITSVTHSGDPRFNDISCAQCNVVIRRARLPINFPPKSRSVLLCRFAPGFVAPEMVKLRPVVVMSPEKYNKNTATIVPLSTVPGDPGDSRTVSIDHAKYANFLDQATFAKASMITTVANTRLYRMLHLGTRRFLDSRLSRLDEADFAAIQTAVRRAISLYGAMPSL